MMARSIVAISIRLWGRFGIVEKLQCTLPIPPDRIIVKWLIRSILDIMQRIRGDNEHVAFPGGKSVIPDNDICLAGNTNEKLLFAQGEVDVLQAFRVRACDA